MFNKTSEQKPNYMQELDSWIDENVLDPLVEASGPDAADAIAEIGELVRTGIKNKVLESYRNGQAAGPRKVGERRRYGQN